MRILEMVDPALAQLRKLIKHKHSPTSLGAVKDILDRAGLKPKDKLEIESRDSAEAVLLSGVFGIEELEELRERIAEAQREDN